MILSDVQIELLSEAVHQLSSGTRLRLSQGKLAATPTVPQSWLEPPKNASQ